MNRCYDCRDVVTKDYRWIDVLSEDGDEMRVAIHNKCYQRATDGGLPIYPEKDLTPKDGEGNKK